MYTEYPNLREIFYENVKNLPAASNSPPDPTYFRSL